MIRKLIRYVLSDGHGCYIRKDEYSNRFVPVRNVKFAEKWGQRAKAANILKNAIPKNIRNGYKIVEVCEEDAPHTKKDKEIKPKDDVVKNLSSECQENDQLVKWSSGIQNITGFVLDAEQRREDLNQELSNVDKEITDINHYIEFGKFNAYQGWMAFNMLRKRLQKRRKIKDEMHILQQLGECKISSAMLLDVKNAIDDLANREYAPRALPELFK